MLYYSIVKLINLDKFIGGITMFDLSYEKLSDDVWKDRIDSENNFDAFRWHQWVEIKDLTDKSLKPFDGILGFGILGFCSDEGVRRNKGRVGAFNGPNSIRKELRNRPCTFSEKVKIYDFGNIICNDGNLEKSQAELAKAVNQILSLNLFPILLGGGHEIAFGHYSGIKNFLEKSNSKKTLGIINFDAHFDIRPYPNGGSSGTMFRQIADQCKLEKTAFSYMCIGVQKSGNTVDLFKTAKKLGVSYMLEKDLADADIWSIFEKIDGFIKNKDHLYVTICSDVFSSAFAPGVSAAQPFGLNPEKVLKVLKYILKSNKMISFDIAEVSPRFDFDNTTANLASIIIYSIVTNLAENNNLGSELMEF